jgi:hypothetical protein
MAQTKKKYIKVLVVAIFYEVDVVHRSFCGNVCGNPLALIVDLILVHARAQILIVATNQQTKS